MDGRAGLVVRLECALHPAVGKSNAELEAASVARLLATLAANDPDEELDDFASRADKQVACAVRALAKVRGNAPCMVPGWIDASEGECE